MSNAPRYTARRAIARLLACRPHLITLALVDRIEERAMRARTARASVRLYTLADRMREVVAFDANGRTF